MFFQLWKFRTEFRTSAFPTINGDKNVGNDTSRLSKASSVSPTDLDPSLVYQNRKQISRRTACAASLKHHFSHFFRKKGEKRMFEGTSHQRSCANPTLNTCLVFSKKHAQPWLQIARRDFESDKSYRVFKNFLPTASMRKTEDLALEETQNGGGRIRTRGYN